MRPRYGGESLPYVRVDALRSHRQAIVELDAVIVADTHTPVRLFETGLPARYYIAGIDISFEHLEPSGRQTLYPLPFTARNSTSLSTA
jgi:uncharacterized protein (DUF427 family)